MATIACHSSMADGLLKMDMCFDSGNVDQGHTSPNENIRRA
jgi:hypothetical protein